MAAPRDVDEYIAQHQNWAEVLASLRSELLARGFAEAIKWSRPVYMLDNKNLIGVGAFKKHVSLWFFQGHLLRDPLKVLSNAQPGKTKEMLHWKWFATDAYDAKQVANYLDEVVQKHEG